MKPAKDIKYLITDLYCKTFGGSRDGLEIWDGPQENYTVWRKEDGLTTIISENSVELYLSETRSQRDEGRSLILDAFHHFIDSIDIARDGDRYCYDKPDFVYIKFKVDKGPEQTKDRVLNVIDSSKSGLAMLITQKDADLLDILEEGDKIRDMTVFGIGARIKGDGEVKHMTKITKGRFTGCYILGVEAEDL